MDKELWKEHNREHKPKSLKKKVRKEGGKKSVLF